MCRCWKGSKTYSRKYEWPHAESQCNVWIRKRKASSRSVKIRRTEFIWTIFVFRRVHFCPHQSSPKFSQISCPWNSNVRIWSLNLEPNINFFFSGDPIEALQKFEAARTQFTGYYTESRLHFRTFAFEQLVKQQTKSALWIQQLISFPFHALALSIFWLTPVDLQLKLSEL